MVARPPSPENRPKDKKVVARETAQVWSQPAEETLQPEGPLQDRQMRFWQDSEGSDWVLVRADVGRGGGGQASSRVSGLGSGGTVP